LRFSLEPERLAGFPVKPNARDLSSGGKPKPRNWDCVIGPEDVWQKLFE
jgi:hypothetical protein